MPDQTPLASFAYFTGSESPVTQFNAAAVAEPSDEEITQNVHAHLDKLPISPWLNGEPNKPNLGALVSSASTTEEG